MPDCGGCKRERERKDQKPRTLERLPIEVTQSTVFKNRGRPIYLCAYCDGDALDMAIAAHKERIKK